MKKVLIINHCSHNKGDNSVLYYLTELIYETFGKVDVTVSVSGKRPFWLKSSINTVSWGKRSIYENTKSKYFFRKFYNKIINKFFLYFFISNYNSVSEKILFNKAFRDEVAKADLIISTGGHHLSSVLDKNSINQQLLDLLYVARKNKKYVLWSQSIGPFEHTGDLIKSEIKFILNGAKLIFYRGESSKAACEELIGHNDKLIKMYDTVLVSSYINKLKDKDVKKTSYKYIVFSIYTADERDLKERLHAYIEAIRLFISHGYYVKLLPMQYKGMSGDERVFLEQIINCLHKNEKNMLELLDEDLSPSDTLEIVKDAFFVFTHKTHPMIYGISAHVPVIAISYHKKFYEMMGFFGLSDYVLELADVNQDNLLKLTVKLESNYMNLQNQIKGKQSEISNYIAQEFKRVEDIIDE